MARAVYQHELQDPDFSWLVNRFQELNPQYLLIESNVQPLVFIKREQLETVSIDQHPVASVSQSPDTLPAAKRG